MTTNLLKVGWVMEPETRALLRCHLRVSGPLDTAIDQAAVEMGRIAVTWQRAYHEWRMSGEPLEVAAKILDGLYEQFEAAETRHERLIAAAAMKGEG